MTEERRASGVVIAGTHSGEGKTTVACGLLAALRKRGAKVQPFKVGPDYLDPAYHTLAGGRPSVNLDLWLMPAEAVKHSFAARCADTEIAVVEGMMGLYDGLGLAQAKISTAEMAGLLGLPVVLVIDASAMAESVGAVAKGFATVGSAKVAGVLFNRVAGPNHFNLLKRAVESDAKLKAFGWLPAETGLAIPERHLGLVTPDPHQAREVLERLVGHFEKTVDVGAILEAARGAPEPATVKKAPPAGKPRARIAVARDAAFHFYYEDNLRALEAAGAELVSFSPVADKGLPKGVGGLYLGGGFPEIYAARLEDNRPMREVLRKAVAKGMPTYAECGGLMYLSSHFVGSGVRAWEMVGAIPGEVRLERGLQQFGYVEAVAEQKTFLVEPGDKLRGHEFHASIWTGEGGERSVYRVSRPGREGSRREGFGQENLHASYVHLHFASAEKLPERFVKAAEAFVGGARGRKKKK